MAKRLGALVAAVVLIAGAILVRRVLDGETDLDDVAGGSAPVLCDPLVYDACVSVFGDEVTRRSPGAVLRSVNESSADDEFVWVTADVWAEMLERLPEPRDAEGVEPTGATTSLAILAASDVTCASVDWDCVAESRPDRVAAPGTDETVGLLGRAETIAAALRSPDFAAGDVAALGGLVDGWVRAQPTQLSSSGVVDLYLADEVFADSVARNFEPHVPAGHTSIDIVVIGIGSSPRRAEALGEALLDRGWAPSRDDVAPGVNPNGLLALWGG